MHTLLKLSLAALITLCPSVANSKPNWVEVAVTEDGDRFYVEQETLRRQASTVWYWVHQQHAIPESDSTVATRTYHSANCKTLQHRLRVIVDFDAQGKVLDSINDGDKGSLLQNSPDSIGYTTLQYACLKNH